MNGYGFVTCASSFVNRTARSTIVPTVSRKHRQTSYAQQTFARTLWRPSKEDVDRLSRGQSAKLRGTGSRAVPHRLNEEERRIYDTAIQQGFITLGSNLGHRRERKGSPLFNIWRMWCDARIIPAIMFVKRGQRRLMDEVWVDISVLRGEYSNEAGSRNELLSMIDQVVDTKGIVETEGEEIENNPDQDGSEIVPTWRVPEMWIKYQFEDRGLAKSSAKKVSRLLAGKEFEAETKSRSKKVARRTSRIRADDDGDDATQYL